MNSCWQNLWPDAGNNFKGFATINNDHDFIRSVRELSGEGFDDLNEEVEELIESHREQPSNEDLQQMLVSDNDDGDYTEEEPARSLNTAKSLPDLLHVVEEVAERSEEIDPIMERGLKFKRRLKALTVP